MPRKWIFAVAALLSLGFALLWYHGDIGMNTVEYRGETIRLAHSYFDWDTYKNDPNNLAPSEIPRVQKLVTAAPMPKRFGSRNELSHDLIFNRKFPGYGAATFSPSGRNGHEFIVESVEIPKAGQDRWLVFLRRGSEYVLIDDFVGPSAGPMRHMTESESALVFADEDNKEILRRLLPPELLAN